MNMLKGSWWRGCGAAVVMAVAVVTMPGTARAQQVASAGPWTILERMPPSETLTQGWMRPTRGLPLLLDHKAIGEILAKAPYEDTPRAATDPLVIALPDPNGSWQRFKIVEYAVMEPALAAAHPELRNFRGEGIDDVYATIRCSWTPLGFQAQVITISEAGPHGGAWLIDSYTRGNTSLHTSFWRSDSEKGERTLHCLTDDNAVAATPGFRPRSTSGPTRRQYRLAMALTGETTVWAGGAAAGLTLANNIVNQLNGIYEPELTVRFVLVAAETSLIYTSGSTDPFTSPNNASTTNTNLQSALTSTIGAANYDVGHVIHYTTSGNNGLAGGIGTVCASNKGAGYSAYSNPNSPFFVIDYVSHELGHQFGGRHTQSNCGGSAGDSAAFTVEAGSGTTIMSYAGICGTGYNVQAHNDPYFNGLNINQINTYLASTSCAATTATANTPPTVSALAAYTIPKQTPFTLTASATDANGDAITYCWEQQDGVSAGAIGTDSGTNPIDRSRTATASASRTIPQLSTLLANTTDTWELVPQVARTAYKWRVTVRDNRSGGGGVSQQTVTHTVSSSGPFTVTSPNAAGTFSGPITATWTVGGTNVAPINCANVKLSLSTDGGNTFPTVLAASTPNTGTANVTLPNINTTTARLKIEAIGNIFFDVSNANFTIIPSTPTASFALSGSPTINDSVGNGNANALIDPGETQIQLTIPVQNIGNTAATGVTGLLTSSTATATITTGFASYPTINAGATASNATLYVISVSAAHVCGAPINLSLAMSSSQGSSTLPLVVSTGQSSGGSPITASYTGPAVAIPDNAPAGINISLPFSGVGAITDVNFRFDGSSCSSAIGATTVGLDHTYVGDLVVKLTSPQGTTVTLIDRPGATSGDNNGNNYCTTTLDDDGAFTSIEAVDLALAPFTGSFLPASALSAFDGQNPDGTWVLNVSDNAGVDTGSVRAFSLIVTLQAAACSPPVSATGACCAAATGGCTAVSQATCVGISGNSYQGDGTVCLPNPCPQPTGACCAAGTGACMPQTSAACASAGNTYQGNATVCSPNSCPQPLGACCAVSGVCTQTTSGGCAVGYQGNSSACSPNPCPQPSGTCCTATGGCTVVVQAACADVWTIGGACSPNPCPQPTGTCCVADGSCTTTTQGNCAATWTIGASCAPVNPCPQPSGSCCVASGACSESVQASCAGAWAIGNVCSPNPCPQPPAQGTCCDVSGGCTFVAQSACGAAWTIGGTCSPNPCVPVTVEVQVTRSGSGHGAVTSIPVGIDCGVTCSFAFVSGTGVALVATPNADSVFLGWSGGPCTGTGTCSFTASSAASIDAAFRCKPDINGVNGTNVQDIFDFLAVWFAGSPEGDFDGTGGIAVSDIFAFLAAWFTGCP